MRGKTLSIGLRATLAILVVTLCAAGTAATQEKVVYSFHSRAGADPLAELVFDADGNLYGTTEYGGLYGYGTVFELSPTSAGGWTETVLHSFDSNGTDGLNPEAGLVLDSTDNLYGTTHAGGAFGSGMVFELARTTGGSWTETVLYSFTGGGDGSEPYASLIFDSSGNLYSTTLLGGAYGNGTVFELTPGAGGSWTETVLYSFSGSTLDGLWPIAALIFDAYGDLFSTTAAGGAYNYGTVFELKPVAGGGWTEAVLHTFVAEDGVYPGAGLILDALGNLYGTAGQGGAYNNGTVFELTPTSSGNWRDKVLDDFSHGRKDGRFPSGLIFDASGSLYGTAYQGGAYGYGMVFELTPTAGGSWTEKPLHNFSGGGDGINPGSNLIFDGSGNLYGTTKYGGASGDGTVFEITP